MGGIFPADEMRFDAIVRTRIPYVVSCGALDMVNFGPLETVPERYRGRQLYVHNPQVTLMRTTPDENVRMAEWIAAQINRMQGPVRLLIPEGGVSALDVPGQPFHDPTPTRRCSTTLSTRIVATPSRRVTRLPLRDQRSAVLRGAGSGVPRHRRIRRNDMPRFQRRDLSAKFQDMVRRGQPIVGGGAGIGLSAKCEEAGGIDLIVLYNSGRYRMAGRGSLAGLLAYGNANEIVLEMAHEVLPVVTATPP